jgi:HK97 gp10 family phage protein
MARKGSGAPRVHKQNFQIKIEGGKEIDMMLENMGEGAARFITAAVREGAEIAKKYAESHAPEGETGRLRRGIRIMDVVKRAGHAGRKRRIVEGSVKIGFNRTKKGAADDAYYGAFKELGFKHAGEPTKQMPAHRFLRDAVDKNRKRIADAITDTLSRLFWGWK